jgi:uncharacterized protein YigE (DUF2233 family)
MKRFLFILGGSIIVSLFWSCHQNIKVGTNETSALPRKDSIEPDSIVLVKDSLLLDSFAVEPFIQKSYKQVFFSEKPYAVKVLVYELKLDTAEIVLIDNKYQSLNHAYKEHSQDYLMLTNAGMFHPRGIPVGLFVEDNMELVGLNFDEDRGNFFLLPNGVFFISCDNVAGVLETTQFRDSIYNKGTALKLATQSGPMLVIDSVHHPRFNKNSPNTYIRSGVGVTADQKIIFILSEEVVNLYTFASIFLEKGCKNALYLDGAISDMYIKDQKDDINNFATRYGPVIGVFSKNDTALIKEQLPVNDTIPSVDTNVVNKQQIFQDTIPNVDTLNIKDEK